VAYLVIEAFSKTNSKKTYFQITQKLDLKSITSWAASAEKEISDAIRAIGRFRKNKGSWFMLRKLSEPVYPSQLSAFNWDGNAKNIYL